MILRGSIFSLVVSIIASHAAKIYRYDVPIVTIRAGNAWTINGNFKLVHVIDLNEYEHIISNITELVQKHMPPSRNREIINYHLTQSQQKLTELGSKGRTRRSINWIGSAWKWVAGNPDAADWNAVLESQHEIITNNNEQFKINTQLLNTTKGIILKTNELVDRMNQISNGREAERIGQDTINQVLVLKDAINEMVRACQLAKSGVINTNLLGRTEVENIITEVETLPYANAVEAIEYGNPSIYTNGSLLLYVLSIPKLKKDFYHHLIVRATIRDNKQIELPFNEILISQTETFGMKSPCLQINNATVCRQSSLNKLVEETCIPRLLKGGIANCRYKMTEAQVMEMITTDMLYLTNFEGTVETQTHSEILNGTYLIHLLNETISINNKTFSSTSISMLQPLPSILTSMTNESLLVDVDHVLNISLHNFDNLRDLGSKLNLSLGTHTSMILVIIICISVLWYKTTRKLNLPLVDIPQPIAPTTLICGTQIFKEGGVNNTAETTNKNYSAVSA